MNQSPNNALQSVQCQVVAGHQIASGRAAVTPYPAGSIELQLPHFKARGLDLSDCYRGTLNLSLKPKRFEWIKPDYSFENVQWIDGFQPETFWFATCVLLRGNVIFPGWIYYPHPETKTQHHHDDTVLEIICNLVPNIQYGDTVKLLYSPEKLRVEEK